MINTFLLTAVFFTFYSFGIFLGIKAYRRWGAK